jgi:hypothetical protein
VAAHTRMTPYDLKEKERTHFVMPSFRLREVQFSSIATVGAPVHQPNSAHHNTYSTGAPERSSLPDSSPLLNVNTPIKA